MKKQKQKFYRGKLTKRAKEREKQKFALALLITILVAFGCYLQAEAYGLETDVKISGQNQAKLKSKTEKGYNTRPEEKMLAERHTEASLPEAKDKDVTELSIQQRIARVAKEEGRGEWIEYLQKLAYCESRLDPKATNSQGNNPSWSVDRGLFQFNSHWQPQISDECAFSVECATRKTIEFIEKGNQHLWVCDKYVKGVPKETVMGR